MAKHFLTGGCGIRPFLDVWILNKKEIFKSKEREKLLKEAGVFTFEQNAEKLASVWVGKAEYDELTKEMENYIVKQAIVFNNYNVEVKGKIVYYPIYMLMFLNENETLRMPKVQIEEF